MANTFVLTKDLGNLKAGTILTRHGRWYVAGSASFEATSVHNNKSFFRKTKKKDFEFVMPANPAFSV